MPEGLPAQFWNADQSAVDLPGLISSYSEISQFKTEFDAKQAALPQKPDDYKLDFELPKDIKLPDGYDFKIDPNDPRVPAVREFAHRHRLPQETVSDLLALHAQFEVEQHARMDAELQAEMAKLGSNGKVRVDAATAYLKANLSPEEFEAARLFIGNATAFAAVEKLIAKATKQGVPGNGEGGDRQAAPQKEAVRAADLFYGQRKG